MTTKSTSGKNAVRLPDPPQPEDMNNYKFFHSLGNGPHLTNRLGNPQTTIVFSEVYLSPSLNSRQADMLVPDLLVAFDVDPAAFDNHNGYVIDQQGKPPDFVLEIASHTTGRRDATTKRERYAALGVLEYWRFDDTGGEYNGAALAGDRLVNSVYEPIPIDRVDDETWEGRSNVLNLDLRWERGQLGWCDPGTGRHIVRLSDERARADDAEARADDAEARVRQLEEEVRRLTNS